MKTIFFALLTISVIGISCKKENKEDTDHEIIVGVAYTSYTELMIAKMETTVNISDSFHKFNKLEAYYYSYHPTTNQNVFGLVLTDTTTYINKDCRIELFTPFLKPEDFFKKSTFKIDSLRIGFSGVRENFYHANVTFKWDTASISKMKFKGVGSVEFNDPLRGTINSNTFYPKQKINFKID